MEYRKQYWTLLFLFITEVLWSQPESILLSGRVRDNKGRSGIYQAIVLNQRTAAGILVNPGGDFIIQALKNDTILINAPGFIVKKLCFRDSMLRNKYYVSIQLDSLHYELQEVTVYPHRNLKEIEEAEKKLGVIPNTDLNKTYCTAPLFVQLLFLSVDIDALYEKWSHKEREKRRVARLEDDELKRNLLKDLFRLYRRNAIINLEEYQFEKFIDYCNFTDDFIKNSSDFELVMAVKEKCDQFKKTNDYVSKSGNH